jgi:hypothetical protein
LQRNLSDARLKRERDSHAEDEKEAGEDHVHVRHRVDLAGGVIGPPGQPFYLCELVDEDHERDVESAKNIKRDDSMMVKRLRGELMRRCGCGGAHGFTFA